MGKILEALEHILNGLCTVMVVNNLPSGYGIVIKAGAVQFFYREGDTFIDSDPNMNLTHGNARNFRSHDATKCVGKMHLAFLVQVPGEDKPRLLEDDIVAPDGQCATTAEVVFGPKAFIAREQLGRGVGECIEMRVR